MTEPLPPSTRSRAARGLTAAAALGRFELQVCQDCSAVQYPAREACHCCLSPRLEWNLQSGAGELISQTTLHHSHEAFFRGRLPWRLGMVRLDCGPILITHLHREVGPAPQQVVVTARLDKSGEAVLIAFPAGDGTTAASHNLTDDEDLRALLLT
jgi:uncharacterized OB-fold protein